MSDTFTVCSFKDAHQAWLDIIKNNDHPYPLGNGTGTSAFPPSPTIQLDGELAQIREINTADRQVTAGCTINIAKLNAELTRLGLSFPAEVFNPAKVTLGGWLGAGMPGSGGGILSARRLLAATMLTPQGRLIHSGAATPKDVAGYDFHRPLVGAFGSLGMFLEVTLQVDSQPANIQFLHLVPKNPQLMFTKLDRCKTVERLWVNSNPGDDMEIMVEQRGDATDIGDEWALLESESKECNKQT